MTDANFPTRSVKDALSKAEEALNKCMVDGGIVASTDHYDDFWARDSFFASLGLLELGKYETVKKNIDLFLSFQKPNGQIPRRINRSPLFRKYLAHSTGIFLIPKKLKKPKPVYRSAWLFWDTFDPQTLLIMVAYRYWKKTGDESFLKERLGSFEKASSWFYKKEGLNGLLFEGIYANWMDRIKKIGNVLYTNCLYFEALKNLAEMQYASKKEIESAKTSARAEKLKDAVNKEFWNGKFYDDWIGPFKKHHYFAPDGNMTAILFGIADKERSLAVLESAKQSPFWPFITTNFPKYPRIYVAMREIFLRTKGYQNMHAIWLWLECLHVLAMHCAGQTREAINKFEKISEFVNKHDKIYEVYNPNGSLYQSAYWKSAGNFAWNSGILILTAKKLKNSESDSQIF